MKLESKKAFKEEEQEEEMFVFIILRYKYGSQSSLTAVNWIIRASRTPWLSPKLRVKREQLAASNLGWAEFGSRE